MRKKVTHAATTGCPCPDGIVRELHVLRWNDGSYEIEIWIYWDGRDHAPAITRLRTQEEIISPLVNVLLELLNNREDFAVSEES